MTIHDGQHVRRDADFYPTLDAQVVVPILIEKVFLPGVIWEPHAGAGHLVKALREQGKEVIATDLHAYPLVPHLDVPIQTGVDFLTQVSLPEGVLSIVMNPPYGRGIDAHVRKAIDLLRPVGGVLALLARSDLSYAAGRRGLMQDPGYAGEVKLCWRLRWVEGTTESGKHNYALYVWDFSPFCPASPVIGHGYRRKPSRGASGARGSGS